MGSVGTGLLVLGGGVGILVFAAPAELAEPSLESSFVALPMDELDTGADASLTQALRSSE